MANPLTSTLAGIYHRSPRVWFMPPLMASLLFSVLFLSPFFIGLIVTGAFTEVAGLLAIFGFTMLICWPLCMFAQALVGMPVEYIFRRGNAHWSLYAITGYALGILGWMLYYDSPISGTASFVLGLPGLFQGIFTYHYGKPRSR